jgi:hypothetical protein
LHDRGGPQLLGKAGNRPPRNKSVEGSSGDQQLAFLAHREVVKKASIHLGFRRPGANFQGGGLLPLPHKLQERLEIIVLALELGHPATADGARFCNQSVDSIQPDRSFGFRFLVHMWSTAESVGVAVAAARPIDNFEVKVGQHI